MSRGWEADFPFEHSQKRVAAAALLLASFLEICGCNPLPTCEQFRATRISAIPWNTLIDQCARCLSQQEMAALGVARGSIVSDNLRTAILRDATIEESLGEVKGPSFNTLFEGDREAPLTTGQPEKFWNEMAFSQQEKPIAWPIPQSVLFIYAPSANRDDLRRIATGFVLTVPTQHGEQSRYLVTARHVVDPEWAQCGQTNPASITVRFNRLAGGVAYASILLEDHGLRRFLTSTDDAADLALIPLSRSGLPDLEEYKFEELSLDSLPTESELGALREEQQVVTAGVSLPKLSGLPDFPVSEPGTTVTNISGNSMQVHCAAESPGKTVPLWLMDTTVQRGVSGAPVYAALYKDPNHAAVPELVGVQAVVWPEKGESGVTPISALRDLAEGVRAAHSQKRRGKKMSRLRPANSK